MRALKLDKVTCNLLLQRGINSFNQAKDFFRPDLQKLHNPFLMKDMEKAVERLQMALEQDEGIMVYGDYDVDGTTSVALFSTFLNDIAYTRHQFYIPDRYKEGYGLSKQGIEKALELNFKLIVCLDCGIKAIELVEYAKSLGIDIIICDHHRPGNELPPAAAVLDPKREDCAYPFKELSGCGVGLKLAMAWASKYEVSIPWESYLDLCAISIACDIVPIEDENRILCAFGLQRINSEPRPGIRAILNRVGKKSALETENLVFIIGPRINAAGRIYHASEAVKLLLSSDEAELVELVDSIEAYNNERREKDKETTEHALEMIKTDSFLFNAQSTVVFHDTWHKGVVGIVASRLIENYYRPTIVLTESEGKISGSARSVLGFDVYEAIDECSDCLIQFGGHKYAAGLTMHKEQLENFKNKFEEVVSQRILEEQKEPEIRVDMEISLDDISHQLYRRINLMAPFGPSNMKPVFISKGLIDAGSRIVGSDRKHLKTLLCDPNNTSLKIKGIGFGLAEKEGILKSKQRIDVVYALELNEWMGSLNVEMMIKDIRPSN